MGEVSLLDVSKRFTLRVGGEIQKVQALQKVVAGDSADGEARARARVEFPHRLGTTLASIPNEVPYLSVDPGGCPKPAISASIPYLVCERRRIASRTLGLE